MHIELPNDEELDLEEWLEAVFETEGARPAGAYDHQAVNPLTGEAIAIPGSEGDVEIYDPDEDAWHRVLHWNDFPPVPGTQPLQPLQSEQELVAEGRAQDNCVATYAHRVRTRTH